MSYNPKEEITSIIGNELTEMLGGNRVEEETLEDGRTIRCISLPFNGYDKGNTYMVVFDCVEDYDKVLNYMEHTDYLKINNCICGGRLIYAKRKRSEMRFKL